MKPILACVLAAMVLTAIVPALAQEEGADLETMALSQELYERMEMYKQMGLQEGEALMFSILTSDKIDPQQALMLMMTMAGAEGAPMSPIMGLMMMSQGASGGAGQPAVLDKGDHLLIVYDGVLYRVNWQEMAVEESVPYARGEKASPETLRAVLEPALGRAREQARQAACQSNLKQLGLAFQMYFQDWEHSLPGQEWAKQVHPYVNNWAVFQCPSRPELAVGYAMNEKLLARKLADITDQTNMVLLFESNVGGENPVGGADDVPEEGVHDGWVSVLFVDGHVKSMEPEGLRELLEREPF